MGIIKHISEGINGGNMEPLLKYLRYWTSGKPLISTTEAKNVFAESLVILLDYLAEKENITNACWEFCIIALLYDVVRKTNGVCLLKDPKSFTDFFKDYYNTYYPQIKDADMRHHEANLEIIESCSNLMVEIIKK